jgi:hypothetical protein
MKLTLRGEIVVAVLVIVGAWLVLRGVAWAFTELDSLDGILNGRI